jgi:hypothetical protein
MSGARPFRMVARMPDDVPRDMRHLCKQFPGRRTFIPSNPGEGGRCSLYAASERPSSPLRPAPVHTPYQRAGYAGSSRRGPLRRGRKTRARTAGRAEQPAPRGSSRRRGSQAEEGGPGRQGHQPGSGRAHRPEDRAEAGVRGRPGTTGTEAAERAAHRNTRRTAGGPGGASGRERPVSANNTARQPHGPLTTGPAN